MKKQIVFVAVFLLFIGCQNNGNGILENEIASSIEKNCKNEICEIDISEITSFKWHRMYVFKESASLEVIEKVLNQKYPFFPDVARRLIFTDSSNKIVYHEDVFPNVEGAMDREVVFMIPETLNYKVFTNPKFTVTKEKIDKGEYYILNQRE